MNRRLLVDIGNSRLKWAWAEALRAGTGPEAIEHGGDFGAYLTAVWGDLPRPDAIYVSNVAGKDVSERLVVWCQDAWDITPCFAEVRTSACGVTNAYMNTQQMGVDRWLAMCGAWQAVRCACCVVDIGTALTVDVVDAEGCHLGGWIIPGSGLMQRALGVGTAGVRGKGMDDYRVFGRDTAGCVEAGLAAALRGSIREVRHQLSVTLPDARFVATGGGIEALMGALPEDTLVRPALVLEGLLAVCETGSP